MKCSKCGGTTRVIDSRPNCEAVFRKRKCCDCNTVMYTSEYETDNSEFNRLVSELHYNKKHNKNITKTR